jgi:hypothetical protein
MTVKGIRGVIKVFPLQLKVFNPFVHQIVSRDTLIMVKRHRINDTTQTASPGLEQRNRVFVVFPFDYIA